MSTRKAATPATKKGSRRPKKAPKPRRAAAPAAGATCDVCGTAVSEQHCRIMCPKCGAMRDCSDP